MITLGKDANWFLVPTEPILVLPPHCRALDVGEAAEKALAASMKPTTKATIVDLRKRLASAVGKKSWEEFAREAHNVALRDGGKGIEVLPMRHGKRGGFLRTAHDPRVQLKPQASARSIGEAILAQLEANDLWDVAADAKQSDAEKRKPTRGLRGSGPKLQVRK